MVQQNLHDSVPIAILSDFYILLTFSLFATVHDTKKRALYNYECPIQGSDVSGLAGGSASPRVSIDSMPNLEDDPMKQKVTERILSLLLRVGFV